MSLMYDLLDSYAESYEADKSEAESTLLLQAIERLNEAFEEETLAERLQGLREAAELVRTLDDEPLALVFDFYLGNELIGTANDVVEGVAVVRPAALKSRMESYAELPQPIGLNNMLASAYTLIDPLGFADEIRTIGELVEASPLTDNEDLSIGLGATYEVHLAAGNLPAAQATRDEIWVHTRALDDPLYYLHAGTYDTELAFEREDWQGMVDSAMQCIELSELADGTNGSDAMFDDAADEWDDESLEDELDEPLDQEENESGWNAESDSVDAGFEGDEFDEDDEFDDDIESDTDYMVLMAAHACGMAKLGRGDEILEVETSNPDPEQPAPYNYYLYWVECLLSLGRCDEAVRMAEEAWEEMLGKGQHYRESQTLCLIIRALRVADRQDEIASWVRKAKQVASQLRNPEPMERQIDAAAQA